MSRGGGGRKRDAGSTGLDSLSSASRRSFRRAALSQRHRKEKRERMQKSIGKHARRRAAALG
jgi:hypothetical protein